MPHLRSFDYRIVLTLIFASVFGLLLNALLPVFARNPLFLLILPAAGAFFLFLIIRPKEMLILLLLARPLLDQLLNLTKIQAGGTQFSVGAAFNLAVIALAIFMAFYYKGYPRGNAMVRWWIIYLLILTGATVFSPYMSNGIRLLINQITYFTMFLIPFLIVKSREDYLFWLKVLAVSFVPAVLCADWNMIHGGKYYPDAGYRVIGTFTHPNILGFYLVLGLTIYFYILKSAEFKMSGKIALLMKFVMVNMIVLLIATKTRNAWIVCFSIFFIYSLLKDKKLLLGLLLLIPLSLAIPTVQDRVISVVDSDSSDYKGMNSFEWRMRMWTSSFEKISERPLQGYGLTTFRPMSAQFSDVGANGAHNVYIELLFEAGIFGMISFIMIWLIAFKSSLKNMFESRDLVQSHLWAILVGYIVSYVLMCSADNLLYYLAFNWYVWFFIGLVFAAKNFPSASVQQPSKHI